MEARATPVKPTTASDSFRRRMVLLSPILVVGLGYVVASATGAIWGLWAWVPVLVYYWAVLGALIAWSGGREAARRWLEPSRSRGLWMWRAVSLALPALFIPTVFLPSLSRLDQLWIIALWLLLALINPWLEEGYWRGLLLDAANRWPGWRFCMALSGSGQAILSSSA